MKDNQTSALFDIAPQQQTDAPVTSDRTIKFHATPDDRTAFEALLVDYANGRERRDEVAAAIWQWDDPLGRQIKAALEAAERHGAWKKQNF